MKDTACIHYSWLIVETLEICPRARATLTSWILHSKRLINPSRVLCKMILATHKIPFSIFSDERYVQQSLLLMTQAGVCSSYHYLYGQAILRGSEKL